MSSRSHTPSLGGGHPGGTFGRRITVKISKKVKRLFRRRNISTDDLSATSYLSDATVRRDKNKAPFYLSIGRTARALGYRRRSSTGTKAVADLSAPAIQESVPRVASPRTLSPLAHNAFPIVPRAQVDDVNRPKSLLGEQGQLGHERSTVTSRNGSNVGNVGNVNLSSVSLAIESGSPLGRLPMSDVGIAKVTASVTRDGDNADRETPITKNSASNCANNVSLTLGISRRFVTTLLKKLPDLAEPNPVKLALSVVRIAIEMKDSISQNKEGSARSIVDVLDQLAALDAAFLPEDSVPSCAQDAVAQFKLSLTNALDQLKSLKEMSMARQIMDYEKCAEEIRHILLSISNAGHLFQNNMLRSIQISASQILIHIKHQTLEKLRPSWRGDYKYVADEQTIRREECTLGTRVHLLQEIITWANKSTSDSPSVFWLTGQAGAGKTTIAVSVAKHFAEDTVIQPTVLGANFFCSRQFPETRDVVRIVPTIAYQLARKCSHFANALVVHHDFDTVFHPVKEQLPSLLVNPWIQCQSQVKSTHLIVIDALDELSDLGSTTFLGALFSLISQSKLKGLKFFITSRSEPKIVQLIDSFQQSTQRWLQDVPIHKVSNDIKKYLRAQLPDLGDTNIELLNGLSNGLFIYAATAVRFLSPRPNIRSREQIELLEDLFGYTRNVAGNTSKFEIDNLYQHIMYDALSNLPDLQLRRRLKIIHMMLSTGERSSPSTIAALLRESGADMEIVVSVLDDLHSVLYVQNGVIYWYHVSFPDFIFDFYRSNFTLNGKDYSFACNENIQQKHLRDLCFAQLQQLRFNMCNIPSSFQLDNNHYDVDPILAYAAINWSHHLPMSDDDVVMWEITAFLELRALFWIEAMNLIKQVDKCKSILQRAKRWIEQHNGANDDLIQRLQEVILFIHFFDRECRKSTPHLYISHLAAWSDSLRCIRRWKSNFSGLPTPTHSDRADIPVIFTAGQPKKRSELITLDGSTYQSPPYTVAFLNNNTQIVSGHNNGLVRIWDASSGMLLKELHGHQEEIYSLAVASECQWIVTGSKDKTVRAWDARTGTLLHIFKGHTNWVRSVAVSHDGTHIVSGSDDGTIRIWDLVSGQWQQRALTGHTCDVWAVAISPTNTFAVSGSLDNTVCIWDTFTGRVLHVLEGHTDWVHAVAISADSSKVVSGSSDNTVRLWSVSTGQQIHCLEGHASWVWSVAMSPDNRFIVSSSADHKILVWDASTGQQLQVLYGHQNAVFSVAFSSDGRHIVSGSQDRSIRVWDISGKQNSVLLEKPNIRTLPDLAMASAPTESALSSEHPNIDLDAWVSKVDPRCAQWKVLDNQWIVSTGPNNQPLMWLNIGHLSVQDPANTVVICKDNNYGSIDFSKSIDILGENWASCYTPI